MEILEQFGRIMCKHRGKDPDALNFNREPWWLVYSRDYKLLTEALQGEYDIIPTRIHEELKKECGL